MVNDFQRDALLAAAIGVVEAAGTSAVTLGDVASAAGVGIGEASPLFRSVDELVVEAALRMCADDLRLASIAGSGDAPTTSAYAHHFARRRAFYLAMRSGPVTDRLDASMAAVVAPLISAQIRTLVGASLTDAELAAMAGEVTAESFAVTNGWIVDAAATDGPESLYLLLDAIVVRRFDDVRALRGG